VTQIGFRPPFELFENGDLSALRNVLADAEQAGLDHLCLGDHIDFRNGWGFDGLINATAVLASCSLPVHLAVYLLALRHPMIVARQLATIAGFAPQRLIFGVGVGGDDPREIANCGVCPSERGRRTDESLMVLRQLLAGDVVDHSGEFYRLESARIRPTPRAIPPFLIGGRSNLALRRTARYGDGWLGLFVSARRFREATSRIDHEASDYGREPVQWRHGLQFWCASGPSRRAARRELADALYASYGIPFEKFERYVGVGSAADIAEQLTPYVEAGCTHVNMLAIGDDHHRTVGMLAEVRELLANAGSAAHAHPPVSSSSKRRCERLP
jgi:alkanesulfonate monooxygenase SsuD/methylene tetrahydromethanopterin reductase-like flavin-dependent oxidoreductase (luciferase family)